MTFALRFRDPVSSTSYVPLKKDCWAYEEHGGAWGRRRAYLRHMPSNLNFSRSSLEEGCHRLGSGFLAPAFPPQPTAARCWSTTAANTDWDDEQTPTLPIIFSYRRTQSLPPTASLVSAWARSRMCVHRGWEPCRSCEDARLAGAASAPPGPQSPCGVPLSERPPSRLLPLGCRRRRCLSGA